MRSVKIAKAELLAVIEKNRDAHRKIFLEAQVTYREQAIKELDAMLEEAKNGKRIRREVTLEEPIDQTREYDSAILMLKMSTDDIIELTHMEFQQFVEDRWTWKQAFLHSNRKYSMLASNEIEASR